jgi:hypothetical protein
LKISHKNQQPAQISFSLRRGRGLTLIISSENKKIVKTTAKNPLHSDLSEQGGSIHLLNYTLSDDETKLAG